MSKELVTLRHVGSQRLVPIVVTTVFGRNDVYYRYGERDERSDRLKRVADGLAQLNYIQISSDPKVSRTHGMISPDIPGCSDLNSTNGTYLNGHPLEATYGQVGPLHPVKHGDAIGIGNQEFVVLCEHVDAETYTKRLRAKRWAVVASDVPRHDRAERSSAFLRERKGFRVNRVHGWGELVSALYQVQSLDPDGVFVLALSAGVHGAELEFDDQRHPVSHLLHLVANIPGRKVVALDLDGDPSACEARFRELAFTDTVLLTCPGDVQLDEPLIGSLRTSMLDSMAQSVAGDPALRGRYDVLADGLDALISPDRNTLRVEWLQGYEGRLQVEFGQREVGEGSAISHSLRYGSTTFRF
ncbi:MAG: FHA domain-containing protein [Planctomycetota bacterium]